MRWWTLGWCRPSKKDHVELLGDLRWAFLNITQDYVLHVVCSFYVYRQIQHLSRSRWKTRRWISLTVVSIFLVSIASLSANSSIGRNSGLGMGIPDSFGRWKHGYDILQQLQYNLRSVRRVVTIYLMRISRTIRPLWKSIVFRPVPNIGPPLAFLEDEYLTLSSTAATQCRSYQRRVLLLLFLQSAHSARIHPPWYPDQRLHLAKSILSACLPIWHFHRWLFVDEALASRFSSAFLEIYPKILSLPRVFATTQLSLV